MASFLLLLHKSLLLEGRPRQSLLPLLSRSRLVGETIAEVLEQLHLDLLCLLQVVSEGSGGGIGGFHGRKDYNGEESGYDGGIIVLQQSSMQAKNKYVSSLDLKYLDAKFIAIHDSQLEMSSNLNEIRKSKTSQLPSIFKSKIDTDQTTLYTSALSPASRLDSFQSRPEKRYASVGRVSADELKEVDKYKRMIAKIKSDNQLLHKEITNLYRQDKLASKQPKKKAVRTIIEVGKSSAPIFHARLSPQARQYERVYQDLSKGDNPYRQESLQLQKKFINSNFHKNFENFLLAHNRRVPEFIKNIR